MASYRLHFRGRQENVVGRHDFDAEGDEAAMIVRSLRALARALLLDSPWAIARSQRLLAETNRMLEKTGRCSAARR
ncbi:MAG TPA: hypothetical protein VN668_04285 [Stellaceae bacterium]|nr:hypothetical protein [Stellaceae bacterium]